jgi:SAM-dependent methyltransferase
VRRLANEIVSSYLKESISFLEFTKQESFTNLKILEINSVGSFNSMHTFLEDKPNCITTMFVPGGPFGRELDGKSIQNLEELTFPNNEFDLVIHLDTLEHVPRLGPAIDEMYRVLKPGGFCIFTVPVRQSIDETFQRVKSLNNSESINVHPPLYHGRGGGPFKVLPKKEDYLEITSFGSDSKDVLRRDCVELQQLVDERSNMITGADFVFKAKKL